MYVLSLLVDDTMSSPSNTNSSGGTCNGKKHVNLGAALRSSLLSSSVAVCVGVCLGVGVVCGVQWWLLRRTARPVLSDCLNASRVLRRRIYNR